MCLAIPSKIVSVDNFRAVVDVYGARREVNLMLMPEEVGVGDYVLVHAGFAIQKVEQEAAKESLTVISTIIEEIAAEDDPAREPCKAAPDAAAPAGRLRRY